MDSATSKEDSRPRIPSLRLDVPPNILEDSDGLLAPHAADFATGCYHFGVIEPSPRRASLLILLLVLLGACLRPSTEGAGGVCGGAAPVVELPTLDLRERGISHRNLRAWVELLASDPLGGRHAGYPGAREAAALLAAQMAELGLSPPPGAGYCQGFPFLGGEDYNVISHSPASADGGPVILLGAHYDGQGAHPAGMLYPGADDNASGVAALLEVARLVAGRRSGGAAPVTWVFVAFGAEEGGQQGARAYLARPSIGLSRIELAINLDMVGRPLPGEESEAIGYLTLGGSTDETLSLLLAAAGAQDVEARSLESFGELRPMISDSEVLASRLPSLLLSTALHEDHHQLTDSPDRIDYGQIERAARLVLELADIIATL